MDKKPLIIVSLCAVVLLVMGSLSNVIGYQSVKSTSVTNSPLFGTRTHRATNQQQNILTSQYLGMGKANQLRFPMRDNKTESLKRAIEIISKMDDKTYAKVITLCIQKIRKDKTISDEDCKNIVLMLHQLKTKPVTATNYLISRNCITTNSSTGCFTFCWWLPGCILWIIIGLPFVLLEIIFFCLLEWGPPTVPPTIC